MWSVDPTISTSRFNVLTTPLGKRIISEHAGTLDSKTILGHTFSTLTVLLTMHAQDYRDVEGDTACGRKTLPIVYPEASRHLISWTLPLWSIFLSWYWSIEILQSVLLFMLGTFCGLRFMFYRGAEADRQSFVYFTVSTSSMFQAGPGAFLNFNFRCGFAWRRLCLSWLCGHQDSGDH